MPTYRVKSIKISHDILQTLVERGTAGVTEVATALDHPKSTVYDHLQTLSRLGCVVNEDGRYRLGTKLYYLGETARRNHELFVNGRQEALALDDRVGEKRVQLVTEENGQGVILLATGWRESSSRAPRVYPANFHLHTNAPGKAILAHLEPEAVERLLDERGLPARTPATITDRDELFATLRIVRERGYAVDEGELIAGMEGVAAPIVTEEGVYGAVSVYGAMDRFDEAPGRESVRDAVQEAAGSIEADFIFSSE